MLTDIDVFVAALSLSTFEFFYFAFISNKWNENLQKKLIQDQHFIKIEQNKNEINK